jgi:hypothetical protein
MSGDTAGCSNRALLLRMSLNLRRRIVRATGCPTSSFCVKSPHLPRLALPFSPLLNYGPRSLVIVDSMSQAQTIPSLTQHYLGPKSVTD